MSLAQAIESRGRDDHQHRHWLARGTDPDHRHDGPARRIRVGDAAHESNVAIPLITTNRINDPATAETLIARGDADMVSMARPFLADPEFVNKAAQNRAAEINTCIGCNQACLDQIFERQTATCW